MMPRIAEDGRSMLFVVGSKKTPSPNAASLFAEGTLSLWLSDASVEYRSETVRLEAGNTIAIGPYTFEVQSTAKSEWGDGWATTLVTREDPRAITAWTLIDEDGTRHEWSNNMSMDGGGFWHRTLESEQAITKAVVEIEAWENPRKLELPFRVESGLGLR